MAWTTLTAWTSGDVITEAKLDERTTAIEELQGQFTTVTTVSVTPTNPLVAYTQEEKEVTVAGALTTSGCIAIPPVNLEAGITYQAYCSGTDKVKVRLSNITASNIATAEKKWSFILVKANP
jgi:hypothetical protein